MTEPFAERVSKAEANPIFEVIKKARDLKAQGKPVLRFDVGETDFPTPENVKAAAKKALDENFTYYTPAEGIKELRQAIAEKLGKANDIPASWEEVMATVGGKQALFNATQALLQEGDECVLGLPYWVSHLEQIKLASATPVLVQTDERFKLRAEDMEEALTPRTKMVILSSPSNPTGAVMDEKDLKRVAALAVERNFWLVSDEVYEPFVFDGKKHFSPASFGAEVRAHTITVNAFSKTYAMTGWRLVYAHAPKEVIKRMAYVQGHSTSHPDSLAQKAGLEALRGPQDSVKEMVRVFEERRNALVARLKKLPGFKVVNPEGAFYAFPDVSGCFGGKVNSGQELANYLVDKALVTVVPGEACGSKNHVRLCYATPVSVIHEAMDRVEKALKEL